ncbi:Exosomal core protein CSL4 [Tolypocladium paradoxum]|uniref:Exosomal core protein CSL4 n=1 Tax=Tolypocladium paradoxum TaxID=94208 RepID=A0A2S4L1X1_9HYPO|nr:Exosomal core protein CSL4 [Tolypocladium paradoxum]
MPKQAIVVIQQVGGTVLQTEWQGVIRVQDVRATEKDKVKMYESFKPGDVVRAQVISLGDQANYYLSTASNELGVIMATSEAGNDMVPVSWKEYKDPETGLRSRVERALPDVETASMASVRGLAALRRQRSRNPGHRPTLAECNALMARPWTRWRRDATWPRRNASRLRIREGAATGNCQRRDGCLEKHLMWKHITKHQTPAGTRAADAAALHARSPLETGQRHTMDASGDTVKLIQQADASLPLVTEASVEAERETMTSL